VQEIQPGQRWISEAEPGLGLGLGLGLVVEVDSRTATVLFPASEEQRVYARQEVPLSRVQFQPGDTIGDQDGRSLNVQVVDEEEGILLYTCHDDAGAVAGRVDR
jgi:ATP-dependent helicase HepA